MFRAEAQAAAASGSGLRLRPDAFVFDSVHAAERVLAAWGRLRHAGVVRVGATRFLSGHRGKVIVVAWRDGTRIGVIALTGTRDPGALALGYAVLADGWLRSLLPATAWGKVLLQIRADGTVSKRN